MGFLFVYFISINCDNSCPSPKISSFNFTTKNISQFEVHGIMGLRKDPLCSSNSPFQNCILSDRIFLTIRGLSSSIKYFKSLSVDLTGSHGIFRGLSLCGVGFLYLAKLVQSLHILSRILYSRESFPIGTSII